MNAVVARPHFLRFIGMLNDATAQRLLVQVELARDQGAAEIHLGMSILGGITATAVAVFNALSNSPTPVFTYNIGSVASAGTTAFVGGHTRYSSQYGVFMIHPHAIDYSGRLQMVYARDLLAETDADETRVEAILRARTRITNAQLTDRRTKDVLFTATEAVEAGIVNGIREFTVPAGTQILQILT
jgi:ATP-dependent Clp protease, protease subunit